MAVIQEMFDIKYKVFTEYSKKIENTKTARILLANRFEFEYSPGMVEYMYDPVNYSIKIMTNESIEETSENNAFYRMKLRIIQKRALYFQDFETMVNNALAKSTNSHISKINTELPTVSYSANVPR